MKKIILYFLAFLFLFYLGICAYVYFEQEKMIFFPSNKTFEVPKIGNILEVNVKTKDNFILNAWLVENGSNKTIIFCHGNGGNVFYNRERIKLINDLKVNAVFFDYRGFGKSQGKIESENDLYADVNAIYDYVIGKGVKPENIIIWGQSLGGAVAIEIAKNKKPRQVIIESTFYSMEDMAANSYWFLPIRFISKYHFRNDQNIGRINSPILILHSPDDEMINISNSERLFAQASEPKRFIKIKGSHNRGFAESYDIFFDEFKRMMAN